MQEVRWALNPVALDPREPSDDYRNGRAAEYREFLTPYQNQIDQLGILWRFPDATIAFSDGTKSGHHWPIAFDSIAELTMEYLGRPVYDSPQLERILAHALAYQEVLAFGESIKGRPMGVLEAAIVAGVKDNSGTRMSRRKSVLEWIKASAWSVFALVLGVSAAEDTGRWWIGVLCGFGAYLLFWAYRMSSRLIEFRESLATAKLLGEMSSVPKLLEQSLLSPTYVMKRLLDTSGKGAVWPSVLPCLIERAARRSSSIWGA